MTKYKEHGHIYVNDQLVNNKYKLKVIDYTTDCRGNKLPEGTKQLALELQFLDSKLNHDKSKDLVIKFDKFTVNYLINVYTKEIQETLNLENI